MKKVLKKIIIFEMIAAMLFLLVACNNDYKSAQKTEIHNYAEAKGKDNYSAENWSMILELVSTGNAAIDAAKGKLAVNLAVCEAKMAIDGIAPKESDIIHDGAYFITDAGWEKYVRKHAKDIDEKEGWIQDVIDAGGVEKWSPSFLPRSLLWVAIIDEKMTVSIDSRTVYQISRDNELYNGQSLHSPITFWLTDDILYIRKGSETTQYKQDTTYKRSESEPYIPNAPENIEYSSGEIGLNYVFLQWQNAIDAGNFGAAVEIKKAGMQDYSLVRIEQVYMNTYVAQFRESDFLQGENFLRIYYIGGPIINRVEKLLILHQNSDYKVFSIKVNEDGSKIIEEI